MPIDPPGFGRREMITGFSASAFSFMQQPTSKSPNTYLELKVWKLHNSPEAQGDRVAQFLKTGLAPALDRNGGKLAGAWANVIGADGPYYVTLSRFGNLAAMGETLEALMHDREYQSAVDELSSGSGLPFVRVESSILRSFDILPTPAITDAGGHGRIFEWRTYESQSFGALRRKVAMFNEGEAQIFMRLGFRPVFFGETVAGPKQPNLMYMVSYDDLAQHDKLWSAFGSDPEWKKLSSRPELKDDQVVANISNVILRPLPFSPVR
jgi:hypothetical protein